MKYFLQAGSSPSAHNFAAVLWSLVWMPVRRMTTVIAFITALGACHAEPQTVDQDAAGTSQCLVRIRRAMGEAGAGQLAEADAELVIALTKVDSITDSACAGLILHNRAAIASISGRFEDGERLAISAIAALEKVYPQDHLALLRVLYIQEQRFEKAERSLDHASSILSQTNDAAPADHIKLSTVRGLLHAGRGQWPSAERDFSEGLSLADAQPTTIGASHMIVLLNGLSEAMKKNHHRHGAREIESRAAALLRASSLHTLDVSDLVAPSNAGRK
jgi:hypothetical protein